MAARVDRSLVREIAVGVAIAVISTGLVGLFGFIGGLWPFKVKNVQQPPAARIAQKTVVAESPRPLTLDDILDRLDRHQQRATFGAVAEFLGREPKTLFNGYARSQRTSWVVSNSTGEPTGQRRSEIPPGLHQNPHVISTRTELHEWLASHP